MIKFIKNIFSKKDIIINDKDKIVIKKLSKDLQQKLGINTEKKKRTKIPAEKFQELLEIKNSNNSIIDIVIENYIIDENVFIKDNENSILIDNCEFNGIFSLLGNNKTIYIDKSEIKFISISNHINSFSLHSSKIKNFVFDKTTEIDFLIVGGLPTYEPTFIIHFMFGGAKINRGSFYNVIILDLKINGCILGELLFEKNVFIEKYGLTGNHKNNGIIHKGITFSELNIDDFIGGPNISFINCKNGTEPDFKEGKEILKELIEENYIEGNKELDNKNISNDNITVSIAKHKIIKKEISIKNTNLDKTQFHNCNFKKSNIYIENSNLSEIITTNFNLPKNIDSKNIEGKRENYRQLKYNFSGQGDSYNALKYYNKEMTILLKYSFSNFKIGDFIILGLGKIINGNGTNWILSSFWIIIFNIIAFSLFIKFGGLNIQYDSTYLLFNLKFSYFLSNINDLDVLFKTFNEKQELTFYFTKIINFYLLYQLIISFRKFNKKF